LTAERAEDADRQSIKNFIEKRMNPDRIMTKGKIFQAANKGPAFHFTNP
jgi:hypothetical protein